uniref:Catalase domain-containing protein n=1 Tax=Steinernema glaseri TaxID=37863 RepID=A0A1I7XZE6_9BILA
DGYRHMHGFGSHTYSLINAQGQRTWVKWHFKTKQGIKNLAPAEAARLAGTDPDYAQRDLFEAIERGDFPKWSVCIQVMSEAEAASRAENPFDVTKTWSQKDYPLIEKALLIANIAGTMASVSRDVVERQLQHFFKADPAYGGGIAKALGLNLA